MRKALSILLFLPLASLAITEAEFNSICTNLSWNLNNASFYVSELSKSLELERQNAAVLLQTYSDRASSSNSTDYDRGAYAGASDMFNRFDTQYQFYIASANEYLQDAQLALNSLRWSDVSGYLASISNSTLQTWLTLQQVDVHMTNGFDRAYQELHNTMMQARAIAIYLFDRSSGQIVTFQQLCDRLLDWADRAKDYYSLFTDIEHEFTRYFELVNSRVEHPDSSLAGDLNQMWLNCLANVNKVITRPDLYHLQDQTSFLASDTSLRLSNEGMIMAENLAVNQRNYLCTVEALRKLDAMTNALDRLLLITNQTSFSEVDLSNITNYLWDIQRPYFELFNSALKYSISQTDSNPYRDSFDRFTNFVGRVENGSSLQSIRNGYALYRNSSTNFWGRLEMYLLNMQGLIPTGEGSLEYSQSSSSYHENINQSTNSVYESLNVAKTVGERFEEVKDKFGELLGAFDFGENGGNWSVIQISPSFTAFDTFEVPALEVSYSDVESLVFACRVVFTAIWYILFGLIGFRLVFLVVSLFVRMVTHTILIVSTLMSGS